VVGQGRPSWPDADAAGQSHPAGAAWTGGPTGLSGAESPAAPAGAWAQPLNPAEGPAGVTDATRPLLGISSQSALPAGREPARRDRAGRRRLGVAMRRLMVTPTFAAGLGVVVAASLAANMTKTVLHFSSPLPDRQCPVSACPAPSHGGTLASARPGVHLPSGAGKKGKSAGSAGVGGNGGGRHRIRVSYRLTEQWAGGFADEITVAGLGGPGGSWSLALSYPGDRIAGVQGAAWRWRSADSGVAQGAAAGGSRGPGDGGQWGGQPGDGQPGEGNHAWDQGGARFVITLQGSPSAPSGCSLNGRACTFAPATGGN
jgi:hypothetical protein